MGTLFDNSQLVLLVTVTHGGVYLGYPLPLLGGWIGTVWKGNPSMKSQWVWIDAANLESCYAFVGKFVIVFLADVFSFNDPGRVLRPLAPAKTSVLEASVAVIRMLDGYAGFPTRPWREFPRDLGDEAINDEEGVLIPARCVQSLRSFYYRVIREGHFYRPVGGAIIENAQGLPVASTLDNERNFEGVLQYAEALSYTPPSCPFCGWSSYSTCPRCKTLHCLPRDGYTYMGNGVILRKPDGYTSMGKEVTFREPDRSETLNIICPSCQHTRVHVHKYYNVPDHEQRTNFGGDPPLRRMS